MLLGDDVRFSMFECYNADFRATKQNYILPNNEECCSDRFDYLVSDLVQSGETADVHGKQAITVQ